jgi:hypothetical protein
MLVLFASWPHMLSLLLHADGARKEAVLKSMKTDWDAFQLAKARGGWDPWWNTRVQRSCMSHRVVEFVFLMAKATNFKRVTAGIMAVVRRIYKGINQTKISEDSFNVQRDQETRGQKGCQVVARRIFQKAISAKQLSTLHRYTEVSHKDYKGPIQREKLPKSLFRPDKKVAQTISFKRILKSNSGKDSWSSFTAQSSQALAADLALMRECAANNLKWDDAQGSTRYNQLAQEGVLMRRKPLKTWRLSLGPVQGSAILFYPVVAAGDLGGIPTFELKTQDVKIENVEWGVTANPKQWEVRSGRTC